MYRFGLLGLVLAILLSGVFGCGSGSPKQERGKDPFKAREEAAPKKSGKNFMKPN
jgi:hypothetical protein